MVKIENVMWLTDFSEDSVYAFGYAKTLAELFGTRLYLLHVIENPTSSIYGRVEGDYLAMEANAREKAWQWLRAYGQRELLDYGNHEALVREGEILTKILETAEEKRVGTIVMGTHGRTGLAHLLLGSVAEKVIRSATCPVYVVRSPNRGSR
jgi:nucleotide-binding universal stress UspA family protein